MQKLGKQAVALISIYDAANDSDGWNTSLDACVDYVNAHSGNIMFHENDKNSRWRYSLGSHRWRNCSEEQMARSIAFFEKYDAKAWAFVHNHRKQTLLLDTDFWKEQQELEERDDYRFFRQELGFMRKTGCKLNDNLCWTDNIAFQFPAQLQTVPDDSLRKIRQLLPHAAKSIELWRTFSILKSRYSAVLAALDHVRVGLCIAEPGGSIIVANEEAQRIFNLGGSLQLGKDKLIHCRSYDTEKLIQESIFRSCATSSGEGSVAEVVQNIGDKNTAQISIEVAPLRDSGGEISSHFNGALITLIDMSSEISIDSGKIAAAYKLTSAEKEVCQSLVSGMLVNDIADSRNVTPDTVKSQLKSIYRKTNCKSRLQLTRLALKANPPIG